MKEKLHNGDILICEDNTYIYIKNQDDRQNLISTDGGWMPLSDYDESLNVQGVYGEFSFNKVYRLKHLPNLVKFIKGEISVRDLEVKADLIWERKSEVKEITLAEISEALGYEVKIVKEEK